MIATLPCPMNAVEKTNCSGDGKKKYSFSCSHKEKKTGGGRSIYKLGMD
jgi:hypothetical protein